MRIAYVIPAYPPLAVAAVRRQRDDRGAGGGSRGGRPAALSGAGRRRASRDVRPLPAGRRPAARALRRARPRRSPCWVLLRHPWRVAAHARRPALGGGRQHLVARAGARGHAEGARRGLAAPPPRCRAPARALRQPDRGLRGDRRRRRRAPVLLHGARVRHLLDGAAAAERHARLEAAARGARVHRQPTTRAICCARA